MTETAILLCLIAVVGLLAAILHTLRAGRGGAAAEAPGEDSGKTEAEMAAEKRYSEGILNVLNYSLDVLRKEADE